MSDESANKFLENMKKVLGMTPKELEAKMKRDMEGMDDSKFLVLLEMTSKIEPGPARLLLAEAAHRFRAKIAN